MFKGPCRGRKCDFWARVRLKKASEEELVDALQRALDDHDGKEINDEAIKSFWTAYGIRDFVRLCEEEPDLCEKMSRVESRATARDGGSA